VADPPSACARQPTLYLVALVGVSSLLAFDRMAEAPGWLHTYTRATGLPLGCALALAAPSIRLALRWGVAPAALTLLVLPFTHLPVGLLSGWPGSLAAVLTLPLVAFAVSTTSGGAQWMYVPLWVGRRSYGIYLWHFPLLSLFVHHSPAVIPDPARRPAAVAATVAVSAASYAWLERPILRRKARLRPQTQIGASRGIAA
jgi:peptidoglycan/LPS O-acetylase OafA/YrhL